MIVRYWHPFQEVETLRRQLDQVFNEVGNAVENAPATWTPAVRLVETDNAYTLTVQLAGIESDAIDVEVTREAVAIAGNRNQPDVTDSDRVLYDGIRYGSFRRVVTLPEVVQNDAVEADFENGLLMLTLPKVEDVRNKVVKVNLKQDESNPEPSAEITA